MNYILPEGFDFYAELNNQNKKTENENSTQEVCLINGQPLEQSSFITLECGHKFNYIPLM